MNQRNNVTANPTRGFSSATTLLDPFSSLPVITQDQALAQNERHRGGFSIRDSLVNETEKSKHASGSMVTLEQELGFDVQKMPKSTSSASIDAAVINSALLKTDVDAVIRSD